MEGHLNQTEGVDPVAKRMDWWLHESQKRVFPISVRLFGRDFQINEGVFSPEVYSETEFYTKEILKYIKPGMKFLDMGCGAGVTGVMAAISGAEVLSADINPSAVKNAQQNAEILGVSENMKVIESNVFDKIPENSIFDVVYWNIPFHRSESNELTFLQRAIFDPQYEGLRKFAAGIKKFTKPGSVILIGTSETLGNNELVYKLVADVGIKLQEVARAIEDPSAPNIVSLELQRGEIV